MGLGGSGLGGGGGGGAGGIDFETTEQETGLLWIDGKTIYQKSIAVTLPNSDTITVAHGVAGIDVASIKVVYEGSGASNGSDTLGLPYPTTTAAQAVQLFFDATNINIRTTSNKSAYSGHITIQYTKT